MPSLVGELTEADEGKLGESAPVGLALLIGFGTIWSLVLDNSWTTYALAVAFVTGAFALVALLAHYFANRSGKRT